MGRMWRWGGGGEGWDGDGLVPGPTWFAPTLLPLTHAPAPSPFAPAPRVNVPWLRMPRRQPWKRQHARMRATSSSPPLPRPWRRRPRSALCARSGRAATRCVPTGGGNSRTGVARCGSRPAGHARVGMQYGLGAPNNPGLQCHDDASGRRRPGTPGLCSVRHPAGSCADLSRSLRRTVSRVPH